MGLERKAIRAAAAAALLNRTAAGDRVKAERATEVWNEETPAVSVYARRERIERFDTVGNIPRRRHRLELAAELFVRDEDGKLSEDLLDDLAEQVVRIWDALIYGATPFPSIELLTIDAENSGLDEIDIDVDGDGRTITAGARLTYSVSYFRSAIPDEDLEYLDWANEIAVSWDFPPPNGTPEAEDVIDLDT